MNDFVVPVCSPDLLNGREIRDANDLLTFPLIQHTTRPLLWKNWFAKMGIAMAKATRGPKFEFHSRAIGAATSGIGIALMSDLVVQREIESGDLIFPFGGRLNFEDSYFFVYPPKMKNDENAQTFGFWLQQQCASFLAANPLGH